MTLSSTPAEQAAPALSIVVPIFNEAVRLESTLPKFVSYLQQAPFTSELVRRHRPQLRQREQALHVLGAVVQEQRDLGVVADLEGGQRARPGVRRGSPSLRRSPDGRPAPPPARRGSRRRPAPTPSQSSRTRADSTDAPVLAWQTREMRGLTTPNGVRWRPCRGGVRGRRPSRRATTRRSRRTTRGRRWRTRRPRRGTACRSTRRRR